MSNEIKKRVVIASVLKPVDETRMFEKMGTTLANQGMEVSIIGYPSGNNVHAPGVSMLPLQQFGRLSVRRLFVPWIIFRKINRVKPHTIIINTPELLVIALLHKLLYGRRVVYDVLENYYRTIRFTETYPRGVRLLMACMVRLTELACAPFIDTFVLAEKGYSQELRFAKGTVILENKLPKEIAGRYEHIRRGAYHRLIFTGTLAPTTGVFEAIRLARKLHALHAEYTLTIIGYAALPEVLADIKRELADAPFITLTGGDKLVAHRDILTEAAMAGTGLIIYPRNPATESSIPTKLYEYLALKLPVVISHTEESHRLVRQGNGGIVLEPNMSAAELHEKIANARFSFDYSDQIFWDSEAEKLLQIVRK